MICVVAGWQMPSETRRLFSALLCRVVPSSCCASHNATFKQELPHVCKRSAAKSKSICCNAISDPSKVPLLSTGVEKPISQVATALAPGEGRMRVAVFPCKLALVKDNISLESPFAALILPADATMAWLLEMKPMPVKRSGRKSVDVNILMIWLCDEVEEGCVRAVTSARLLAVVVSSEVKSAVWAW